MSQAADIMAITIVQNVNSKLHVLDPNLLDYVCGVVDDSKRVNILQVWFENFRG